LKVSREAKEAQIFVGERAEIEYQPGDTVKAFVTHRPFRGAEMVLRRWSLCAARGICPMGLMILRFWTGRII